MYHIDREEGQGRNAITGPQPIYAFSHRLIVFASNSVMPIAVGRDVFPLDSDTPVESLMRIQNCPVDPRDLLMVDGAREACAM